VPDSHPAAEIRVSASGGLAGSCLARPLAATKNERVLFLTQRPRRSRRGRRVAVGHNQIRWHFSLKHGGTEARRIRRIHWRNSFDLTVSSVPPCFELYWKKSSRDAKIRSVSSAERSLLVRQRVVYRCRRLAQTICRSFENRRHVNELLEYELRAAHVRIAT
jgi:hypothetical protein